ncbi:MAG: lysophospholipid acyltransferase family protein [Tissierella sp.]|uniref:lysophospholipid acyltransferase family protein n=1 Tax=Tissierella sp. TaxID=41274 RepID=UPI003F9B14D6
MFYDLLANIVYVILSFIYRFEVDGKENIPSKGNLIVCSNHSNNLDPILISILFPRKISWMGKKELFNNKMLKVILSKLGVFPVNRDKVDISAVKNSLKLLKDKKVLGIFPEGTRVKELDINNAKSGVSLIAIRSKTPVLPIYIESNYNLFSKVKITIGKCLYIYEDIENKPTQEEYKEFSKYILSQIYSLKNKEVNY